MALWWVLDRTAKRCACISQAPAKQSRLNSDKKVNFGAERNGAFAAKPLGESPVVLRTAAYFEFLFLLYLPSIFAPFCFGRRFPAPSFFYCRKNHFSVMFEYDFTP